MHEVESPEVENPEMENPGEESSNTPPMHCRIGPLTSHTWLRRASLRFKNCQIPK
jgi:hypothetical protein